MIWAIVSLTILAIIVVALIKLANFAFEELYGLK